MTPAGPAPPLPVWVTAHPDGVTLAVAAQPGAKRTEVAGIHAGALKIKLAAPPVDGAANAALLAFLAAALGVRSRDVSLLTGAGSRKKVVMIRGVSAAAAVARLVPG